MDMVEMPLNPIHVTPNYPRRRQSDEKQLLTTHQINQLFTTSKYKTWKTQEETHKRSSSTNSEPTPANVVDTCAICLEQLENDDQIRILQCSHIYHQPCIDTWLTTRHARCPLCKRNYFPDPDPPKSPPPPSVIPVRATDGIVPVPRIALLYAPTTPLSREYPPSDGDVGEPGRPRTGLLSRFHFPPFRPSHINRRRNSSNLERGTVEL